MTEDTTSRRRVLGTCGAALAMAGTAGCSGLPPLGTAVRYGEVDVPDPEPPGYREWLPAPTAHPTTDEDYDVMVYTPPPSDAVDWTRASVPRAILVSFTDYLGVHIDDVELAFTGEATAALLGEFEPSAVEETAARTSYEPDGTVAGYDVYRRPDTGKIAAVSRNRLLFSSGPAPREAVEAMIGAHSGEVPRYHEEAPVFADLSAGSGRRRWNWLVPGGVEREDDDTIESDTVGWATGFEHDEDSVYFVQTWLFPPDYDLTESGVKAALNQRDRAIDATAVDIEVADRTATIASQLRQDRFLAEHANEGFLVPYATWNGEHDEAAEQLTIRHEAGDTVSTERLSIRGDDLTLRTDAGPRIGPGDELTVSTAGVAAGATIQMIYESADGKRSSALLNYDLP